MHGGAGIAKDRFHSFDLQGVLHQTALADMGSPDLELRLRQQQRVAARPQPPCKMHQRTGERDERQIGHQQVETARWRASGQRRAGEFANMQSFQRHHACVAAQPIVQLAVANVESDHPRRPAAQQHIGETAGALSDVQADEVRHVEPHVRQCAVELEPAT